jgi:regulator of replication initiation timing
LGWHYNSNHLGKFMTRRPYELLVRFANDGTIAGASATHIVTVEGRDYPQDPQPLSGVNDPAFAEFAEQFAAAVTTERDELRIAKSALEQQVSDLTQQVETLTSQVESLTSDMASLTLEKGTVTDQLTEATATITGLQSRVAELIEALPFNPRIIDATAFYNRITKDELLMVFTSSEPSIQSVGQAIAAYKANDWPIVFESVEMQGMIGLLLATGYLTQSRVDEITRDATQAEAYRA